MTLDELNARLARVCQCPRVAAEGAVHPRGYLLAVDGHTADVDLSVILVAATEGDACESAWQIIRAYIDLADAEQQLQESKYDAECKHATFVRVLALHTLGREEKA